MKYLSLEGLTYFWGKVKKYVDDAVKTVSDAANKVLKLENITDVTATAAEVNHLSGVKSNVQTQLDAKAPTASPEFTGTPKAVTAASMTDSNKTQIATLEYVGNTVTSGIATSIASGAIKDAVDEATSSANGYTDTKIAAAKEELESTVNSAIAGVYKYKGSKETYEALPTSGNVAGDVYNVVAEHGNTPAGTNYAWDGSAWDAIGGDITDIPTATIDTLFV